MPRKKRKIAALDCETDPFEHGAEIAPFIWGLVIEGGERHIFKTAAELIDFLKDKDYIIYTHNGGKFDYHFILDYIEDFTPVMIISGRLAKFKIGDCEFRDSYNIFPLALAAYKKDDFDYNKMKKEVRHKYMREITKYLINDCEYLLELVLGFIDRFGNNLTLAGSAMSQWKKLGHEPPKTTNDYYEDFERFYYGGRVQVFESGIFENDNFYLYDINSAYPYAMLDNHPYDGLWDYVSEYDGKPLKSLNFYTVIARANGILPLKDDKGKLIFPNDNEYYKFNVSGHELILYSQYSNDFEIKSYRNCLSFLNFQDYIYNWYHIKNEAEKGSQDYLFAKLMMNSLYGKFGANPDKYKEYELIPQDCVLAHEYETDAVFAGELGNKALMARDLLECKQRYYDVATAASITGFVRAYLYSHVLKIQNSGGIVYYCDTDSIVFKHNNPNRCFNMGDELGQWDCEGEFDYMAIAGKKLYALKHKGKDVFKTASKGVKLKPNEIISVAKGNTETWKSEAPTFSIKRGRFYQERKVRKID